MKDHIFSLIDAAIDRLIEEKQLPGDIHRHIQIDRTKDKTHGDLASNIALTLAKPAGKAPREIATLICNALPDSNHLERTEIAGPGFINFFLRSASNQIVVIDILQSQATFGQNNLGSGRKVQVEYVSANPTGPLHIGHGRGAAIGDSICRLLENSGWLVTREFYYNDAGQQINNLAHSVQARCKKIGTDHDSWQHDWYQGDYIIDVANAYMLEEKVEAQDQNVVGAADINDIDAIRDFAIAYLRREQDIDLDAFGVDFDVYFLESSLYKESKVEKVVTQLTDNGYTYEDQGALWLKTTEFGDDKDRVMRKSEGGYTYFVPDVAYHVNKWERGFSRVINEQGADHHSTITRVRAGLQALNIGIPEKWPDYVLHQMVLVVRNGVEVKISKRAGSYVTLRDLVDEVGKDATRYFLCSRAPSSQLTFDIDLALSQSNDNPVYYIQYAHARACSVMNRLIELGWSWDRNTHTDSLNELTQKAEHLLLKRLAIYPEIVAVAAENFEPHTVANYLRELAGEFHSYYNNHKLLVDEEAVRNARLALCEAVRQVIVNGLSLLGISAPEVM